MLHTHADRDCDASTLQAAVGVLQRAEGKVFKREVGPLEDERANRNTGRSFGLAIADGEGIGSGGVGRSGNISPAISAERQTDRPRNEHRHAIVGVPVF
ncbi:MAG: hypothetical protein ACK6EB_33860, partial [Planctomyces sp.]